MKLSKNVMPVVLSLLALSSTSFFAVEEGARKIASCEELAEEAKEADATSELLHISTYFENNLIEPDQNLIRNYYDNLTRGQQDYLAMNQGYRNSYGLSAPQVGADYSLQSLISTPAQNYAHSTGIWGNYIGNPFVQGLFTSNTSNLLFGFSGATAASSQQLPQLVNVAPIIPKLGIDNSGIAPTNPKPLF